MKPKTYSTPTLRELPWLARVLTPTSEYVLLRDGDTFLVIWPAPGNEHRVFDSLQEARAYMQALIAMELSS